MSPTMNVDVSTSLLKPTLTTITCHCVPHFLGRKMALSNDDSPSSLAADSLFNVDGLVVVITGGGTGIVDYNVMPQLVSLTW